MSVQEMRNWNLQFAQSLLSIQARILQPEAIAQTADKRSTVSVFFFICKIVEGLHFLVVY